MPEYRVLIHREINVKATDALEAAQTAISDLNDK
jgi:hypothetical protein